MRIEHYNESEAIATFRKGLTAARSTGKWMGVAFGVGEDGKLSIHRTTFGFPRGLFDEAVQLLKDHLTDEINDTLPDDPLPPAPRRRFICGGGES